MDFEEIAEAITAAKEAGKIINFGVSNFLVHQLDPFELAFAATIHKAQGRTIGKVVINLHCHPDETQRLKFAQIFVALSRVKTRQNIRLIRHPNATHEQAYSRITELRQHPDVTALCKGFKPSAKGAFTWDANLALS